MPAPTDPPDRLRRLLRDLRADAAFRSTFIGAIVLPTVCALGVIVWVLLAILRSR